MPLYKRSNIHTQRVVQKSELIVHDRNKRAPLLPYNNSTVVSCKINCPVNCHFGSLRGRTVKNGRGFRNGSRRVQRDRFGGRTGRCHVRNCVLLWGGHVARSGCICSRDWWICVHGTQFVVYALYRLFFANVQGVFATRHRMAGKRSETSGSLLGMRFVRIGVRVHPVYRDNCRVSDDSGVVRRAATDPQQCALGSTRRPPSRARWWIVLEFTYKKCIFISTLSKKRNLSQGGTRLLM